MFPCKRLAALLASLLLCATAEAAVLTASRGNAVSDYSAAALVSFDLDLADFSPTRLDFELDAGDLHAPWLNFNAIVRNVSGVGLRQFTFRVDGLRYAGAGSVTPTFGSLAAVDAGDRAAALRFAAPEYAEFHFGNPLAQAGAADWMLDLSGMRAGQRFSIIATIAEPAPLNLICASLFLFAVARSRNKPK